MNNSSIKARIEALQKQMDAQRPNGGILIRLSDSWMAFSASTIHKKSIFATEAEARLIMILRLSKLQKRCNRF